MAGICPSTDNIPIQPGDLLIGNTDTPSVLTRLGVGGVGTTLLSDGKKPVWGNASLLIGMPITGGTPGSVLFVGAGAVLAQNNSKIFWDDSTFRLKVSANAAALPTPSSGTLVHVGGVDSNATIFLLDSFSAIPQFTGRASQGTAAAPTALLIGNALFQLSYSGRGATGYSVIRQALRIVTTENWTDTAQGNEVDIFATAAGTIISSQVASFSADTGTSLAGILSVSSAVSATFDSVAVSSTFTMVLNAPAANQTKLQFQKAGSTVAQWDVPGSNTTDLRLFMAATGSGFYFTQDILGIGTISNGDFPTGAKGLIIKAGTALTSMAAGTAGLYAQTIAGVTHLIAIASDGTTIQLI